MIELLLKIGLFLAIFATGWFHSFLSFLCIIAILEVFAAMAVGYQDSLKGDDRDGREQSRIR